MTNPKSLNAKAERPIVYIRPVAVASLPSEIRAQAGAQEQLYAIGTEEGTQLALVKDRALAFVVARQNDLTPVSVH
ncbi:DUF1150 domain-containing protein [Rhodobacteraceae bacterium XHP0102]|nr:DUF1150 domain-containing protein [Rhodobacteraceae bacterium XHP0102]